MELGQHKVRQWGQEEVEGSEKHGGKADIAYGRERAHDMAATSFRFTRFVHGWAFLSSGRKVKI